MIIRVQSKRWDSQGNLIAAVLDGHGGVQERAFTGEDAERIERTWAQNQFDLDRYANLPPEFPTPAAIPVEIDAAA
jgi:hypothetical protein